MLVAIVSRNSNTALQRKGWGRRSAAVILRIIDIDFCALFGIPQSNFYPTNQQAFGRCCRKRGTGQILGSRLPICCLSCSPTRPHRIHRRKAFDAAFPLSPEDLLRPQRPRNPRNLEPQDLLDIRHYALSSSCLTCPLSCFVPFPAFDRLKGFATPPHWSDTCYPIGSSPKWTDYDYFASMLKALRQVGGALGRVWRRQALSTISNKVKSGTIAIFDQKSEKENPTSEAAPRSSGAR
jgi:hypothetical protein